ncbi:MAG: ferritin-like domain-containing protein [Bacillota bacterium]
MHHLTLPELLILQDHLTMEQTATKQFSACAEQCSDTQAKELCRRMAQDHQRSFQRPYRHLAGGQT